MTKHITKYLLDSRWGESDIQVPRSSEVLGVERTDFGVYVHMLVPGDIFGDEDISSFDRVSRTFRSCDMGSNISFDTDIQYKYVGHVSNLDGGLLHYFERMH